MHVEGHHDGAYVFGKGVIAFPKWFNHKHPGVKLYHMSRQVGARHGILMKNAMVHYTMFDAYLEWSSYMKHKVKDPNALLNRVLTKLQTVELKGIIRARGIFYARIHHVMLEALKSKRRLATQSEVCTFLVKLQEFCTRMQQDASFLLDTDEKFLSDDDIVQSVYNHWSCKRTNATLIDNLFRPDAESRDITISCLEAYAQSVLEQLQKNSTEYLVGGKKHTLLTTPVANLSAEQRRQRKHLMTCPTTSDPMERVFGVFDYDLTDHTNLSLGTAAGMTCYRMNKTREWTECLPPAMQTIIYNLCRRFYRQTTKQITGSYTAAAEVKYRHQLSKVAGNKHSRHNKLKQMVKYDDVTVFLELAQWQSYKDRATSTIATDKLDKFLLSQIQLQLSCLRYRAGVAFGKLPRLSTGGDPYPLQHVMNRYENLLRKFAGDFKPKPVVKSIEERLIDKIDAFRNGTVSANAKLLCDQRRQETVEEIARAREAHQQDLRNARAKRGRRGGRGGRTRGRGHGDKPQDRRRGRRGGRARPSGHRTLPDFTGRRVAVPDSYFGQTRRVLYGGRVGKWLKYVGTDFNEYWGYSIEYDAGDQYDMIESDVHMYLVDEPPENDVRTKAEFVESEWSEVGYVWVKELNGSWLEVMLWTHNTIADAACIQYSDIDFEGLFPYYKYSGDTLFDSDGDKIEMKRKNPSECESEIIGEGDDSSESELIVDFIDKERDLYTVDGDTPEWLIDN